MSSKFYLLEMSEGAAEKIAASKRHPAARRGAEFKEGWAMGKEMAGYKDGKDGTPASPIFGMTRYEVYDEIETLYIAALQAVKDKRGDKFDECNERVILLKSELGKRAAAQEIARATRKA
jgi:hypothetical protein